MAGIDMLSDTTLLSGPGVWHHDCLWEQSLSIPAPHISWLLQVALKTPVAVGLLPVLQRCHQCVCDHHDQKPSLDGTKSLGWWTYTLIAAWKCNSYWWTCTPNHIICIYVKQKEANYKPILDLCLSWIPVQLYSMERYNFMPCLCCCHSWLTQLPCICGVFGGLTL